jgi:CheY-like chemotaxis protein
VTRILVADDNSNIQRMVGLALKDQGIDVVAVGNGGAAVRKISDMRPDLVLADVFMPVRSGYEVCEFVKSDRSLSHIPVILLVGAFDPLDEQEAQRVGADGVLKKPFVPPEPLISMVKSALSRSSVSPTQESEPAIAQEAPPASRVTPAPVLASVPMPPRAQEAPSQEIDPPVPQPIKIPEGSELLAFGSLLDTPTVAPLQRTTVEEEGDTSFLVSRHPSLDEGRTWNATHTQEADAKGAEEEDGNSQFGWRRDAGDELLEEQIPVGAVRDWRDAAAAREIQPVEIQPVESIDLVAPANGSSETQTGGNAAASSDLSVAEMPAVVQEPAAPDRAAEEPEQAIAVAAPEDSASGAAPPDTGMASPADQESVPGTKSNSWYSVSTSPWDAEGRKANPLAETWNLESTPAPEGAAMAATVFCGTDTQTLFPESTIAIPSAADPLATPGFEAATPSVPDAGMSPQETGPAQAPPAALTTDMEALVTKVLEKMSPDLLQNMTRELLKPIVEAIVRGDLDLKK